ncbi:O-methyltransferase [Phascolomyces articulosus]|uniref:O-methyltransferase n=1 Tax=Phascolomyces articulosus TaxID=60185 RepID=A0AAD5K422_9FUNG|nr:O-methyltransferase [Phascolomyces articulosus]
MMIPETERKFLYHLIKLLRPTNILEIGTFTGASAIIMATALGKNTNGKLVTLDVNPTCMDVARKYVKRLQLENRVDLRLGLALDSLKELIKEEPKLQFDFIFIDAYKDQNIGYFDFIMDNKLLSDRGAIVVDDALFHGLVHRLAGYEEMCHIELEHWDLQARCTVEFNRHVQQDPRVQVTVLPIFNGLSLISNKTD